MPEKLEGRVLRRAGAVIGLAAGSLALGAEVAPDYKEATYSDYEDRVEARSFSSPVQVITKNLETTTTTLTPTTTTTIEAPQPGTVPPSPPPRQISGAPAEWMVQAGIPSDNYDEVDYIMTRESGWNPAARNGGGCIGLGQNCPDSNGEYWLDDACPDWAGDPVCQLVRFQEYAFGRYGSWERAAAHSQTKGWW